MDVMHACYQARPLDESAIRMIFMDSNSTEISDGFGRNTIASQIEYTVLLIFGGVIAFREHSSLFASPELQRAVLHQHVLKEIQRQGHRL